MKVAEALGFLGLAGIENITIEIVKKAYREASLKYHPDLNPAGNEMMKIVNLAYETIIGLDFTSDDFRYSQSKADSEYPKSLADIIAKLKNCIGLTIEIVGVWVWVGGETKTYKGELKAWGLQWASQKKLWYYRPAEWKKTYKGKPLPMDEIRTMYGSRTEETYNYQKIQ